VVRTSPPPLFYFTPSRSLCFRAPPSTAPPPRGASRHGRPRHLPAALVGFVVLLALCRSQPHPKPWSLAREHRLRRASGEPPPRRPSAPPRAVVSPPPAACVQPGPSDGHGRPGSKGGAYPLDRSTVDRWTKSTCAGPPRASCLRQPCISPANHSSPRGTPSAFPPAALAVLQKGPPVSGIHNHALPPIEILSVRSCFQRLSPCPS
jgi:hypothetical protein